MIFRFVGFGVTFISKSIRSCPAPGFTAKAFDVLCLLYRPPLLLPIGYLYKMIQYWCREDMKLCFECSEYPPGLHGGIGSLVQILARGFVKAGHEVRVVGLYSASKRSSDYEDDCGVQVWRLGIPEFPYGWVFARLRLFALVHSWCESGDIDLIEVPDFNAPAAGWRTLSVPVIVRLSGSGSYFATEMGQQLRWVPYKMDRMSMRRGDFICATSRYIGMRNKSLFGLSSEPDAFIYNPVDVPS